MADEQLISENIQIDNARDEIILFGIKYAGGLFRDFGLNLHPGQLFTIVSRKDNVLTLRTVSRTKDMEIHTPAGLPYPARRPVKFMLWMTIAGAIVGGLIGYAYGIFAV